MVPMHTTFIMLVSVFVLIGSLRGWAKEILVSVSVILALFVEVVLTTVVPPIQGVWIGLTPPSKFWIRVAVFSLIVIFGYASPTLAGRFGANVARERLQDILLGFFLGLLNGVLIVGSLWFFLQEAHYGVEPAQVLDANNQPVYDANWARIEERTFDHYADPAEGIGGIIPPDADSTSADISPYLPPRIIVGPSLYVAVALAFVFVIVVFV